ncbi:metal ABC transporter permease [bacterium]|nr:metal ABC transporter permease [bacterium]
MFDVFLSHAFMQKALFAGLLASLACGITGAYVVIKRITFISGGISHGVLGGIGIAYYFGFNPMTGAFVAALLSALLIGFISIRGYQNEDTIIGALWAVGMAVGILFIYLTPGYSTDLMSYLFGNILMVTSKDILLIAILDISILVIVISFYKQFLAVCFDEEFARIRGINVDFYYILLLCLVACTVVILIQVVGLILIIALLTLPAAIAGHLVQSLWKIMVGAFIFGILFTTSGLVLSYDFDIPSGATIVLISGLAYIFTLLIMSIIKYAKKRYGK